MTGATGGSITPLIMRVARRHEWSRRAGESGGRGRGDHKGKVVAIEYMMSQIDLQAGKSWPELAGLKNLPPIDHVNMGFMPTGASRLRDPAPRPAYLLRFAEALKTITPTQ